MRSFNAYLKDKLKSKRFRKVYAEERILAELAIKFAMAREHKNLTQKELSEKAGVTQQQVSKLECGENGEATTLIRVGMALDLRLDLVAD